MAEPTAYEQYMLELVNRARANPAAEAARLGIDLNQGLAAGTISTAAKQPLAFSPLLVDAARTHSGWMLNTDTFSHTGAGGSDPGARMKAAGYAFSGAWSWGENIAITYGSNASVTPAIVGQLEDGLFKSAGHRKNLLADGFREVGIGLASGEYKGSQGVTATQDFAKSGTLPFLTGVAFTDRNADHFYQPGEGLGGLSVQAQSSTGALYKTTTWAAGGYQMALPIGTYTVSFSGGGLTAPVVKTAVIGTRNVDLDLEQGSGSVPMPTTGAATIVVNASGTPAGGVNAHFKLLVDGKTVGEGITGTTAKDFAFTAKVTSDTAHKVQVQYDNDAVVNGVDRNLMVNKVTINGKAVLPTASNVSYDKFALDGKEVIAGQAAMKWNGTLIVNADKSYFPATAVKAAAADQSDVLAHLMAEPQSGPADAFPVAAVEHAPGLGASLHDYLVDHHQDLFAA